MDYMYRGAINLFARPLPHLRVVLIIFSVRYVQLSCVLAVGEQRAATLMLPLLSARQVAHAT